MLNFLSRARHDPAGHQIVDIVVDRGYRPDAIEARAGIPIRLVFHREDDDQCSERVVFSSPRVDRRLAARGTTTVELPGQPPGEVRFTCGMGRYRGRIQVIDSFRPSTRESLRRMLASVLSRRSAALALAISTILPVALLSLADFRGPGGLALATAVLAAWIAICQWARHAAPPT